MLTHAGAAFGAGAQSFAGAEVDQLAGFFGILVVAKVKFELPVLLFLIELQHNFCGERPARLGAEAFQRANFLVGQKVFHLGLLERTAGRGFAEREAAALTLAIRASAGIAAVVFFHLAAALGTRRVQRDVVARHGVAVVLFRLFDDVLGHGGDFAHEGIAAELALLHQRQLVFPLAGQGRLGQFLHAQAAQQGHQLKGLGRGNHLPAVTQHVFLVQQAFNDGRPRGGGAQTFFLHGLAQLIVFHQFACALHGAQQGGFGVTRGRAGFQGLGGDRLGQGQLARLNGDQHLAGFIVVLRLFAVNGQPARLDQDLAIGAEMVLFSLVRDLADAGGHLVFRRGEEHGHEATHHQVIQLLLGL